MSDPPLPKYTMLFDQSAHMDWDWIRSFAQNYWYYTNGRGVDDILTSGIEAAQNQAGYHYTICEMGFLRHFVETNPQYVDIIKRLGEKIQIVGGGVVSPDCLVNCGEAFIRNYLVGQSWLKKALDVKAKPHCWIPDDFGQGPELPTLLSAMGFVSAVVARVPDSAAKDLEDARLDIFWRASDKSKILLHYVGNVYNQSRPLEDEDEQTVFGRLRQLLEYYGPISDKATTERTMYWPIMDDFSVLYTPIPRLQMRFEDWNQNTPKSDQYGAAATNTHLQFGTFDDYVTKLLEQPAALKTRPYNGTPLWTGYYASRPKLKKLHCETTRNLVAAEIIALLTQPSNPALRPMLPRDFWSRVEQVWSDFVPSTHHDFITGTASDGVYAAEQLPLLRGTAASSRALRDTALNALAGMTSTVTPNMPNVLIANSLGFARSGIVELEDIEHFQFDWSDNEPAVAQTLSHGGMAVFVPSVESFGYRTGYDMTTPSSNASSITPDAVGLKALYEDPPRVIVLRTVADLYTLEQEPVGYTIHNSHLSVTIRKRDRWGISSLIDTTSPGRERNILESGKIGNEIIFYNESSQGDIYRFANETSGSRLMPRCIDLVKPDQPDLEARVLELGPLLIRIRTEALFRFKKEECEYDGYGEEILPRRFVREYELRAGEPFLRMATTGAAPPETAVMTAFPLQNQVCGMAYGTSYHWSDLQPLPMPWTPPVFQAAHDFMLPYAQTRQQPLAAFYHDSMPAWAIDADRADSPLKGNVVIGCLLRNSTTRANQLGAVGTDFGVHTQRYAIRIPSGLTGPETGQPLREAQQFHTPLFATRVPEGGLYPGMLEPRRGSLAKVSSQGDAAMLTVAKPGTYDSTDLMLRIYQPTNSPLDLGLTLPSLPSSATLVTALETDWKDDGEVFIDRDGEILKVLGAGTISTVCLPKLGRIQEEG